METLLKNDIEDLGFAVMTKASNGHDYPIALFFSKYDAENYIKLKNQWNYYIKEWDKISE